MSSPACVVLGAAQTAPRAAAAAARGGGVGPRATAARVTCSHARRSAAAAPPLLSPGGSYGLIVSGGRHDATVAFAFSSPSRSPSKNGGFGDAVLSGGPSEFALDDAGGFVVKQKLHSRRCDCHTCITLRELVDKVPAPVAAAGTADRGGLAEDPIFMSQDGGFVVGRGAQKHHISTCHCPNCNHMRFKREAGTARCVTLDAATLHDLVGEDMCNQVVLDDEGEFLRRQRIGQANKGKLAWNKGLKHSPETIALIKANTARAMQDPEVRRRMRDAASKNKHTETTKMKIRRTVRDTAHKKIDARMMAKSKDLGPRRGKVGVCSIGIYARRVSAVMAAGFGAWTTRDMEKVAVRQKAEAKQFKKIAREERKRQEKLQEIEGRRKELEAKGIYKVVGGSRQGVPKTEAHKAAISAAMHAKWSDPSYVGKQQKTARARKVRGGVVKDERAELHSRMREMEPQARHRAKLVQEMKDIYIKAAGAVNALEKRKIEGLEVDEAMLVKALAAVEETRKVLTSVGASFETEGAIKSGGARGGASMESGSFDEGSYEESSYEEAGEEDFGPMVHVRGGKTVGVDVDANGINME